MNEKDKMTKKISNKVISMIGKGCPYREIAKKTGYSISTISRMYRKHLQCLVNKEVDNDTRK